LILSQPGAPETAVAVKLTVLPSTMLVGDEAARVVTGSTSRTVTFAKASELPPSSSVTLKRTR